MNIWQTYIHIEPSTAIQCFQSTSSLRVCFAHQIVLMFKHQRRANTAMPTNTAMLISMTGCETEIHIYRIMGGSKLPDLCKIATLHI